MYSLLQKRAHKAVENALLKGRLIRSSSCDNCGSPCKPHAHHDSYAKPLEVRWLCQSCHAKLHPGNRIPLKARIAADLNAGAIY